MDQRLQCSLCLDRFKDPRILSCFHTFCLQCLQTYLQKSCVLRMGRYVFSCPLCRAPHLYPSRGPAQLQKNFYLQDEASAKPRSSHPMCQTHPEEDMRFYCKMCKITICRDCKVLSHTVHQTEMVDIIKEEMKKQLENDFNKAEKALEGACVKIKADFSLNERQLVSTMDDFRRKAGEMKAEIDDIVRVIGLRMDPHFSKNKQSSVHLASMFRFRQNKLHANKSELSDAVKKGNSHKILNMHKNIKESGSIDNLLMGLAHLPAKVTSELNETVLQVQSFKQKSVELLEKLKNAIVETKNSIPDPAEEGPSEENTNSTVTTAETAGVSSRSPTAVKRESVEGDECDEPTPKRRSMRIALKKY